MSDIKRVLEVLEEVKSEQGAQAERMEKMNVSQELMRQDLNYHIEQTVILKAEVAPMRASHQQLLGALKLVSVLALFVSIAVGLSHLF